MTDLMLGYQQADVSMPFSIPKNEAAAIGPIGIEQPPPASQTPRNRMIEVLDLDAPIDLAFADDGALLVLEHGRYDAATNAFLHGTGRLSRIHLASGERQELLRGLTQPSTVVPTGSDFFVVVTLAGRILRLVQD